MELKKYYCDCCNREFKKDSIKRFPIENSSNSLRAEMCDFCVSKCVIYLFKNKIIKPRAYCDKCRGKGQIGEKEFYGYNNDFNWKYTSCNCGPRSLGFDQ